MAPRLSKEADEVGRRAASRRRAKAGPCTGDTRALRPRPAWLRALGREDPPASVTIGGGHCTRTTVFKHDTWAATALYAGDGGKIICKFGRAAPLFGLPMRWVGTLLAQHEARVMRRLVSVPRVPEECGPVVVGGSVWRHAVSRRYVEGCTLLEMKHPDDSFFPTLGELLRAVHARGVAYVDLDKADNILVGRDGQPHLIDFQISFAPGDQWPGTSSPVRWLLRIFQDADWYHYEKLRRHYRPDQMSEQERNDAARQPWWIRAHRFVTVPLRKARRRLLVWVGVRRGSGRADTEAPVERPAAKS